ncbi:MAG: potassium/proton antiporter [Tidjanibacter sp.]|nr:potassium/proton antiporter [Tidjanibacter sp.]
MVITSGNILLIGSIILFVSILAGKVSSRFGAPTLLLFLLVGMAFGTDGVGIEFDNFGAVQFVGMLALSIILFSGGMDTSFEDVRPVLKQGIVLATLGVVLTTLITGLAIHFVGGWLGLAVSLPMALLIAAVMSSTDSASVFAILRSKRVGLKENLRPLLELESGSNDPMAYILTIMLIQVNQGTGETFGEVALTFLQQMGVGALMGYLSGKGAALAINRLNVGNKSLYSVLLLSLVFFTSSFTDLLGGNGYLAVYIAGMVMGNCKLSNKRTLATFLDGVTWLMQIVMFLMLGLLVNPHELVDVAIVGVIVGIIVIVVSRPMAVWLCLLPFGKRLSVRARHYISWVGLRGAAPILFATYPKLAGLDPNNTIFNIVFFITIFSLVIQGTTVSSMARALDLADKSPEKGFDIDLPDEVKAALTEVDIIEGGARDGALLRDVKLPERTLVMMIRRGDQYIVPNGATTLHRGDKLLLISEEIQAKQPEVRTEGGIVLWESLRQLLKRNN